MLQIHPVFLDECPPGHPDGSTFLFTGVLGTSGGNDSTEIQEWTMPLHRLMGPRTVQMFNLAAFRPRANTEESEIRNKERKNEVWGTYLNSEF